MLTLKKTIALTVIACLSATNLFAFPQDLTSSNIATFTPSAIYGTVTDSYTAKNNTGKLFINIMDIHCDAGAQNNISNIIEEISQFYNADKVFVEGYYKNYDISWFTNLSSDIKSKVQSALLEQGLITGAELYAVKHNKPHILYGADNETLHKQNIERALLINDILPDLNTEIKNMEIIAGDLKNNYYSSKILKAETNTKLLNQNLDNLTGLLRYAKKSNIDTSGLGNLNTISAFNKRRLNIKPLSDDIAKITKLLSGNMSYNLFSKISEQAQSLKNIHEVYVFLNDMVTKHGIKIEKYPHAKRFLQIYAPVYGLNPFKTAQEQEYLANSLYAVSVDTVYEYEILFLDKYITALKDYVSLQATPEIVQFVNNNDFKFHMLFAKYSPYIPTKIMALKDALHDYYFVNEQRNDILLDNTLKHNAQINILVTGGYHSKAIAHALKEKDISYIIISPNLNDIDKTASGKYKKLLTRDSSVYYTQALALQSFMASVSEKVQSINDIQNADMQKDIVAFFKNLITDLQYMSKASDADLGELTKQVLASQKTPVSLKSISQTSPGIYTVFISFKDTSIKLDIPMDGYQANNIHTGIKYIIERYYGIQASVSNISSGFFNREVFMAVNEKTDEKLVFKLLSPDKQTAEYVSSFQSQLAKNGLPVAKLIESKNGTPLVRMANKYYVLESMVPGFEPRHSNTKQMYYDSMVKFAAEIYNITSSPEFPELQAPETAAQNIFNLEYAPGLQQIYRNVKQNYKGTEAEDFIIDNYGFLLSQAVHMKQTMQELQKYFKKSAGTYDISVRNSRFNADGSLAGTFDFGDARYDARIFSLGTIFLFKLKNGKLSVAYDDDSYEAIKESLKVYNNALNDKLSPEEIMGVVEVLRNFFLLYLIFNKFDNHFNVQNMETVFDSKEALEETKEAMAQLKRFNSDFSPQKVEELIEYVTRQEPRLTQIGTLQYGKADVGVNIIESVDIEDMAFKKAFLLKNGFISLNERGVSNIHISILNSVKPTKQLIFYEVFVNPMTKQIAYLSDGRIDAGLNLEKPRIQQAVYTMALNSIFNGSAINGTPNQRIFADFLNNSFKEKLLFWINVIFNPNKINRFKTSYDYSSYDNLLERNYYMQELDDPLRKIADIVKTNYGLKVSRVKRLQGGFMNEQVFLITAGSKKQFVFKFLDNGKAKSDYVASFHYQIANNKMLSSELIPAKNGNLIVEMDDKYYTLETFLSGIEVTGHNIRQQHYNALTRFAAQIHNFTSGSRYKHNYKLTTPQDDFEITAYRTYLDNAAGEMNIVQKNSNVGKIFLENQDFLKKQLALMEENTENLKPYFKKGIGTFDLSFRNAKFNADGSLAGNFDYSYTRFDSRIFAFGRIFLFKRRGNSLIAGYPDNAFETIKEAMKTYNDTLNEKLNPQEIKGMLEVMRLNFFKYIIKIRLANKANTLNMTDAFESPEAANELNEAIQQMKQFNKEFTPAKVEELIDYVLQTDQENLPEHSIMFAWKKIRMNITEATGVRDFEFKRNAFLENGYISLTEQGFTNLSFYLANTKISSKNNPVIIEMFLNPKTNDLILLSNGSINASVKLNRTKIARIIYSMAISQINSKEKAGKRAGNFEILLNALMRTSKDKATMYLYKILRVDMTIADSNENNDISLGNNYYISSVFEPLIENAVISPALPPFYSNKIFAVRVKLDKKTQNSLDKFKNELAETLGKKSRMFTFLKKGNYGIQIAHLNSGKAFTEGSVFESEIGALAMRMPADLFNNSGNIFNGKLTGEFAIDSKGVLKYKISGEALNHLNHLMSYFKEDNNDGIWAAENAIEIEIAFLNSPFYDPNDLIKTQIILNKYNARQPLASAPSTLAELTIGYNNTSTDMELNAPPAMQPISIESILSQPAVNKPIYKKMLQAA